MSSKNLFSKIKNVFTINKNTEEKQSPAKVTDPLRKSISFGDMISDEIRQIRRRGLSRKYQPYTREEILQDCLESDKLFQLFKAIDEASNLPGIESEGRNLSIYFKKSNKPISKQFYDHFFKAEKVDISSQDVLELTSRVQESIKEGESPLLCIALLGFYHQEEPVLEHIYPDLDKDMGLHKDLREWLERNLATYGMPDPVYNTPEDFLYFLVNVDKRRFEPLSREAFEKVSKDTHRDNTILYGVSFFKQMPLTTAVKEKYPNINRPYVQRAVCVLSRAPIYGHMLNHFEPLVKEYFKNNSFDEPQALNEIYTQATPRFKEISINSHELLDHANVKKLVGFLKEKTTTIWKALFLEKRVLVFSEYPGACSTFIHSLISLFPCACHFDCQSRSLSFFENHYQEYGLPLHNFNDKCLLLPYFGMHHVEEVSTAKGFFGGTSNFLIKTLAKVGWDILIDIDANTIQFKNDTVKKALAPSKQEKEMINSILKKVEAKVPKDVTAWNKLDNSLFVDKDDEVEFEGTEEWIRQKFYTHIKDLLTELEFFKYHVSEQRIEPALQQYNAYLAKKGEDEGKGSIIRLSTKSNSMDEKSDEKKIGSAERLDSASPSPFKGTGQTFFPNEEKKEGSSDKIEEPADKKEEEKTEAGKPKSNDEIQNHLEKQESMEEIKESKEGEAEEKEENLPPEDPRVVLKKELAPVKSSIKIIKDYGVDWLLEWAKTDNFKEWASSNRELIRNRSKNNPSAKDQFWLYENGDMYLGGIANGLRHGHGQYLYRHSRLIYKGEWVNDKKTGSGMLSSVGSTDLVYDGNFKNDKKDGFGRLIQGKERYVGHFFNDYYEGNGVLIDSDQNVYEGEFKDGYKWGMGKLKFANGETYLGEVHKDISHGQGQFIYLNGDVYSGWFKEGKRYGQGILQVASGDIYEGDFINDEFTGLGTLKKSDGHKYQGEFYKGVMVNGKEGTIHYPDGTIFEGIVTDYKPQGVGKLIKKNEGREEIIKGRFENGELVEEFKEEEKKPEEPVPVAAATGEEEKQEKIPVKAEEEVELDEKESDGDEEEGDKQEEKGKEEAQENRQDQRGGDLEVEQ